MNHWDYVEAEYKVFGLHKLVNGRCSCDNENCEAAGKHPRSSAWQFTPHWTDEQLEVMEMTGQLDTGFGVICDGSLIIDIDPRNGGDESFKKLVSDTGIDFKAISKFIVATGGGGHHIYFTYSGAEKLRKSLKEYEGIDFKTNGFVVGAGSLHRSGGIYEAEKGDPTLSKQDNEAPQKLIDLLTKPEHHNFECGETASSNDVKAMLEHIPSDIDYEEWVSIGMAIHHNSDGEDFNLWDEWSRKGDKYNGDEMQAKWHSFGKAANPITIGTLISIAEQYGYSQPVTFETSLTSDEEESGEIKEPVNVDVIDTLSAPGVLGDCIEYINNNSRYPRKQLAVAAAITALGNIAGLRWRDHDFGVTSNLFTFCVAGSATGKEAIQTAQKELQAAVGFAPVTYGKIKSEQELTRNIVEHQLSSYVIDEFGIFLQKLENATTRGSSSYLEGVVGDLMSFYSKADGRLPLSGDMYKHIMEELQKQLAYCNKARDENQATEYTEKLEQSCINRIEQLKTGGLVNPFLSLIGFTTPVTFNSLVTYQAATNGFIGRALIFEEKDNNPKAKRGFRKQALSNTLTMKLNAIATGGQTADYSVRVEFNGEHEYVTTTDEAHDLLLRIQDYLELYADHHCETTGLEPIVRRAFEQILKVSMIVAIGCGGSREAEHVAWAYALVKKDIDNKINLASGNIATQHKEKESEVLAKLKHVLDTEKGFSVSVIKNKNRTLSKEHIEKGLEYLEKTGYARREETIPTRGPRSIKWYKA